MKKPKLECTLTALNNRVHSIKFCSFFLLVFLIQILKKPLDLVEFFFENFEMTQKNVTSHSKLKALEQSRSDEK